MGGLPTFYERNTFWKFVLREDEVSLKLIFDNAKNFFIAAAILGAGRIYQKSGGTLWEAWGLIGASVGLMALNSLQTWVLILKTFYHFTSIPDYAGSWKEHLAMTVQIFFLAASMVGIPVLTWRMITAVLSFARAAV